MQELLWLPGLNFGFAFLMCLRGAGRPRVWALGAFALLSVPLMYFALEDGSGEGRAWWPLFVLPWWPAALVASAIGGVMGRLMGRAAAGAARQVRAWRAARRR